MAPYMPTIFPFHSCLFINKTILFRKLSPIITQVFDFLEYIGDSEKAHLFSRSFNQTRIFQIINRMPRISCLSNAFDERLEDTGATKYFLDKRKYMVSSTGGKIGKIHTTSFHFFK